MESPLKVKRCRQSTNWNNCVICQKKGGKLKAANSINLQTLKSFGSKRQDDVYRRLAEDDPDECIVFHWDCYKTFTNKHTLKQENINEDFPAIDKIKNSDIQTRSQPSESIVFRDHCIICLKKSHKQVKKLIRFEDDSRVESLKRAAVALEDNKLLYRLSSEDLFAIDASYHNACMANLLSKSARKIQTETQDPTDVAIDPFENAFSKLISDIDNDLHHGTVYNLTFLLQKFKDYLPDNLPCTSYQTKRLQQRLEKHYGDNIAIGKRTGQGQSNFVYSKKVSMIDTITTATKLKEDLKLMDTNNEYELPENTKEATLHEAACILQHEIMEMKNNHSGESYFNSSELTVDFSEKFIPPMLLHFIRTLLGDDKTNELDEGNTTLDNKRRIHCALAESIIYNCSKMMTPFVFGLAVQLHHDYGKRALIDCLHAHGLSISYSDLRQFLTSLASDECNFIDDGVYVPSSISPIEDGGNLIQEGDDNVDINTETIDGKNTFHSMARVIFQKHKEPPKSQRKIKRVKAKSLTSNEKILSEITDVIMVQQPNKKAEPPKCDKPMEIIEKSITDYNHAKDFSWCLLRMVSRQCLILPREVSV